MLTPAANAQTPTKLNAAEIYTATPVVYTWHLETSFSGASTTVDGFQVDYFPPRLFRRACNELRQNCYEIGNSTQTQLNATNIDEGPLESIEVRYRVKVTSGTVNDWVTGSRYDFGFDYPLSVGLRGWCNFVWNAEADRPPNGVWNCNTLTTTSGTVYEVQIRVNSAVIATVGTSDAYGTWSATQEWEWP